MKTYYTPSKFLLIMNLNFLSLSLFSAQEQSKKLSVFNNTDYSLKLKADDSFMPQYFLPQERHSIVCSTKDFAKLFIAPMTCPLNEKSPHIKIPSLCHHITIREKDNALEFTGNDQLLSRIEIGK